MERAVKIPAFTLLELTLKRSLTAVLSKPQWQRKWQDAAIRRKWLDELRREFVLQTFTQSLAWRPHEFWSIGGLEDALASDDPATQVAAWCEHVRCNVQREREPPRDKGDGSTDNGDGDDDDYDEDMDEDDDEKEPNAYVFLVWYVAHATLRERVLAIAPSGWTRDALQAEITTAESLSDASVVPRALALFSDVSARGATVEAVAEALGGIECRADVLAQLRDRCAAISDELASVEAYVAHVLDALATSDQLQVQVAQDEAPVSVSPAGIPGIWLSDDLIPSALTAQLAQDVAVLEDVPDDAKDWHPNTNEQVLDVVHPSLFCCEFGTTKQLAAPVALEACATPAAHMLQIIGGATELVPDALQTESARKSRFQWLPSEFDIGADGSVRIRSYINNLHPVRSASMYTTLERVFARFVPLLERTLSAAAFPDPDLDSPEDFNAERPALSPDLAPGAVAALLGAGAPVSLRGRRLQVIVKVAEIVLRPDAPTYGGGTWHIEGTAAEQIVATGIYYFGCANVTASRLAFRVNVREPWYEQSDDSGVAVTYGLFNDDLLAQTLGSVATLDGRCLVFPNGVQHKVEPFELADASAPGVRKLLAFFVVDPSTTIPSTAVVPPQQREWVDDVQRPLLQQLQLFEFAERAVKDLASGDTMTLDDAKRKREELMAERSALAAPDPSDYESYFSLCEH